MLESSHTRSLGWLWGLWGSRSSGLQPSEDLEGVVDAPLQAGEGADHDDAQRDPPREQVPPPHVLDHAADGGGLGLAQLGHHVVGWVGHYGAEHTGYVPGGEADHQLLVLGALGLGLGHHVVVQHLHHVLEHRKLHHGIGNLAAPQGSQRLEQPSDTLLGDILGAAIQQAVALPGHRLHPHLNSFKRA